MPVELLGFPPLYCIVGAYRLMHDDKLWRPLWLRSRKTLKRALLLSLPFMLISYPLTGLYVSLILSRSPLSPRNIDGAAILGINVMRYTTITLVLGQISMMIEWALRRELKKAKEEVYVATVKSRGKNPLVRKGADFWQPYTEEWSVPPIERAKRAAEKQSFYTRLTSPIMRIVILKVLLTPLSFIPGLALVVTAAIRSLTTARVVHRPYFEAKKMTPFQIELWITERQIEYRTFGFVASLMERIPLLGIALGVSNRIGAAMWAHDLEKQQHAFSSGEMQRTRKYVSKTAALAQEPSDLPSEAVGSFPTHKGPVKVAKDGTEVGAIVDGQVVGSKKTVATGTGPPPPLPARR
ncbi:hypothetical protein OIO90_004924 [Microbotryomycetes sp. JL221]|nr:hypothetical protein OIO90_004924 [Microbotryomycetes sp. JL221]